MADELDLSKLSIEIDADAASAGKNIDALAVSLGRLNENSKLTRTLNNLNKLHTTLSNLKTLSGVDGSVQRVATALSSLGTFKATGFNSTINSLKKLPEVMASLDNLDMSKLADQMERVAKAVKPLADEMDKVSKGFSSLPSNIQKAIKANQKLTESNKSARSSFKILGVSIPNVTSKLLAYGYAIRKVVDYLGTALASFNEYVENVNLFSVSMGEFTDQAAAFTQAMQDILGVDASEAMRNMGVIQNLVTSFGATGDQAYTLSKNLTQLGYDMSSFFNISTEDAFTKLQAAISGELEPTRRLGVDISEARLQQELFALGINASVDSLNQADKAMLRYIAIMKQTGNAQGDLARTLNSPANMMRVLNAQIDLLTRSIGSLLIPMLNAILPPLIAAVRIIREFIEGIAALLGVTVEFASVESSVSSVGSAVGDIGDNAAKTAKQMNYLIGGFDELNVMNKDSGSSTGNNFGGILGGITLPEYDIFEGLADSKVAEWLEKLRSPLTSILKLATLAGAVFLAWKVGKGIIDGLGIIRGLIRFIAGKDGGLLMIHAISPELAKMVETIGASMLIWAGAIGTIVLQFVNLYSNSEKFRQGLNNVWEIIKSIAKGFLDGVSGGLKEAAKYAVDFGNQMLNLLPEDLRNSIITFFSETLPQLISDLDLGFGDLATTAIGFGMLFIPGGQIPGAVVLGFEVITLALRGLGLLTDEQMETIKKAFTTAFTYIGKFVGGVISSMSAFIFNTFGGIITFLTGVFTSNWSMAWEGLKQLAFAPIEAIRAFFQQVFGIDIIEVFRTGINKVIDLLNGFIDWVNDHLHFEFDGLEIMGEEIIPAFDFQLFTLPRVPHLAKGGVLSQPSLVLAGEYASARSNPEIVTPQNIMRDTVAEANADMVQAIVEAIRALESAMAERDDATIHVSVDLDGEKIYANQQKVARKKGYRISRNPAFSR